MKIELLKDHSILGNIAEAGTVFDLHNGVAQDLVDRGIAKKVEKKAAKKKADK
jgi:hypothetical protein